MLFSEFNINFPPSIERSVTRRRAEFLAGRIAAKRALALLGVGDFHVGVGTHRNPIWPVGILGSITHNSHTAVCAVARMKSVSALGIDLEHQVSLGTANNIKQSIIDRTEEAVLRKIPIPFETAFTLAFSAKESLFKAIYPDVGRYFDFDSAKICQVDVNRNRFLISLRHNLSSRFVRGTLIKGCHYIACAEVFTIVSLPYNTPPESELMIRC
jgi:4'-phosphopantetheinyl transferase EntD